KDEILNATISGAQNADQYRLASAYFILFIVGLLTAGLTAFYTFRAYFMTFWGEERIPEEAGHHAHESPRVMTVPLILLAIGAVAIGLVVGPLTHKFGHLLSHLPPLEPEAEDAENMLLMIISSLVALSGIAVAWLKYVAQPDL